MVLGIAWHRGACLAVYFYTLATELRCATLDSHLDAAHTCWGDHARIPRTLGIYRRLGSVHIQGV